MTDFQVCDDLLKLARKNRHFVIEPKVYYDVIKRYDSLYRTNKVANSRLAHAKFQFKLNEAKAFYDVLTDTQINCIVYAGNTLHFQ